MRVPDYQGGGLVNLVAEVERRLTGASPSPGLHPDLAKAVPDARTYVLVLLDGLGDLQLTRHPAAAPLLRHRRGALDASFSTQTSVATATIATGLPPSQHGLLAYLLHMQEAGGVVNTLWWFTASGNMATVDLERLLPSPNLAERLTAAGRSAVTIEPQAYLGSPLDQVLYRGAKTMGAEDESHLVEAALETAATPGQAVVVYLPHVDAAAHAEGTASAAYADALETVSRVWHELASRLPDGAAMLGTADHGIVDVDPGGAIEVTPPDGIILYGDARVLYVHGEPDAGRRLARGLPARWVDDLDGLWGPEPYHGEFAARMPDGLIAADPGHTLHPPADVVRLIGNHGGLSEEEVRIPVLVAEGRR